MNVCRECYTDLNRKTSFCQECAAKPCKITYFKESGKYYTEAVVQLGSLGQWYFEASDTIRKWNKEGKLPGLASGTWPGFILINDDTLVIPF